MKARLITILLVSMLILAMAAPLALAQATTGDGKATAGGDQATAGDGKATAGDDRDNDNADITIVDCSQVRNAFGSQDQYANASAQYQSEAIAIVSQELNISQNQVNECFGDQTDDADTDAAANELEDGKEDVLAGTDPGGTLPDTGGPSLLALGAGLALVAGASLIRIRR